MVVDDPGFLNRLAASRGYLLPSRRLHCDHVLAADDCRGTSGGTRGGSQDTSGSAASPRRPGFELAAGLVGAEESPRPRSRVAGDAVVVNVREPVDMQQRLRLDAGR